MTIHLKDNWPKRSHNAAALEGLSRRFFQEKPKAPPRRTPKASPRFPKASQGGPKAPQGDPKGSPGVPKGSPRRSQRVPQGCSKGFQGLLENTGKTCEKQWFSNDFQIRAGSKLHPSWPTLAHVGPCWPKLIPNWPKLTQVGPSWPQVGPKLAPS